MKMLWKEWQQQKWLFLISCIAGISFPVLDCLMNRNFRADMGSIVVLAAGALFAIILAIATTHHDIKKGTDNFLQSKPIHIWKLFTVKFILGSIVLLLSFLFVMSLDFWSKYKLHNQIDQFAWTGFCYTYPIALFLFAAAMFLLVVLRDSAKAVLLAIWLALLIYFLPLLISSLEWLNVFEQINNAKQHNSLLQFILTLATHNASMSVGTSVPVKVVHTTFSKALWQIVTSPDYLQYLLFFGVAIAASVAGVVLTVIAFKRNWRWQSGQKSIVWALGLSAAFIFGVAMVQVGHNLEPVKQWNGKEIINPAVFDWSYMPAALEDGIPQGQFITWNQMYFHGNYDTVCVKDDLMFRVSCGYQWGEKKGVPKWDDEVIRHFVLQIYRFPYAENSDIAIPAKGLPDFAVGAMRLFSTELLSRYESQQTLGCFVKGNYLYTAYRPQIRKHKDNRIDLKNMPIYFATIDITNPEKPTLIGNIEIEPTCNFCRGFANYGDYCYLSDGGQLLIISVTEPTKPEIIRRIPYIVGGGKCDSVKNAEESEYFFDLGGDAGFPSHSFLVVGDQLLCNSYTRIAILDLAEPTKPKVIYDESFAKQQFSEDERIQATAYRDDYIYISTNNGLYIRKLAKQANGTFASEEVGKRTATPIEKLAGRKPLELLFYKDYLVEASSGFGLIVYDVSDHRNPKRVYHAATQNMAQDVGIWNDLIYVQDYGFKVHFFDIPETN